MKVDLKELAAAFAQSDVRQGYVDTAAGKVIMMADDLAERDAMQTAMMHAFAASRPREDVKDRLFESLKGAVAVTRFRRQVRHLLLKPAWESFKQDYLMQAARDWCEENAVEYREP